MSRDPARHRTTLGKNGSGVWCVWRWIVTDKGIEQDGLEREATEDDWRAVGGMRKMPPDTLPTREPDPDIQRLIDAILAKPPEAFRKPPTASEKAEAQRGERITRAGRAGIPALYYPLLTSPQDRPAIRIVRDWHKSGKQALLLSGANQCGKSFAAACWLSTIDGGRWVTASEIGLAIQPDPEGKGVTFLRGLRTASALVIDNFGERCGPAGYEEIESQIMHQISRGHRLIVTSDWAPKDVWGQFGSETHNRIYSRWQLVGETHALKPWDPENPEK